MSGTVEADIPGSSTVAIRIPLRQTMVADRTPSDKPVAPPASARPLRCFVYWPEEKV